MRQGHEDPDGRSSSPHDSINDEDSSESSTESNIPHPSNARRGNQSASYNAPNIGPGVLDQDYACQATSMTSGTIAMPSTGQAPSQGQPESEHDAKMANGLIKYIRDSLKGAPGNLPELKGLRVKLPEAYEGKDDFDRLESWLQGLLRYFKLHHLTRRDRDGD